MTEDEMVGWHHQLDVHGFEQALGDGMKNSKAWCAAVHGVAKPVPVNKVCPCPLGDKISLEE